MNAALTFLDLPEPWLDALGRDFVQSVFTDLNAFFEAESGVVYPARDTWFAAYKQVMPDAVKAVLLGQDPYHEPNQAHGIAFSVRPGVRIPKSLANIFTEYAADLHETPPDTGSLLPWTQQGVLLLNAVLTVRAHEANAHAGSPWTRLTDRTLEVLAQDPTPKAFVLWGLYAQKKRPLVAVENSPHLVIESPHPSPLSAYRGFFGSRPFSRINAFLEAAHRVPINWRLPVQPVLDL